MASKFQVTNLHTLLPVILYYSSLASSCVVAIYYCCYEFTMVTDCPVTGQEWSDCASPCNLTCNNRNNVSCLTVCTTGCSCPAGTVIDEETNSCVAISSCPVGKLSQLPYHDILDHMITLQLI